MIMMARDRDYSVLLEQLRGRRVLVWTCNTCARLCNVGGADVAGRLADRLAADGVEVTGTLSTSASCLAPKVVRAMEGIPDSDVVLALTCDVGAVTAGTVSDRPVVNPIITFGPGYVSMNGEPRVMSVVCGNVVIDEPLSEVAARNGAFADPFV